MTLSYNYLTLLTSLVLTILCGGVSGQDYEWDDSELKKALGIGLTVFIVIIVVVLIVVIGVPIAICFCCGVCCFKKRRRPAAPVVQVYSDGQKVAYGPPGNVNMGMTPTPTGYPQQQQPHQPHQQYVSPPQPQLYGTGGNNGRRPAGDHQSQMYGNFPVQTAASPVMPPDQSSSGAFQGSIPVSSGMENPAYNTDPNYIPNRFRSTTPGSKSARNDPVWNAVTDEVKNWQKDHNIYYGNTYKPGTYGAPPGPIPMEPAEHPGPHPQDTNPVYRSNDNFIMY